MVKENGVKKELNQTNKRFGLELLVTLTNLN